MMAFFVIPLVGVDVNAVNSEDLTAFHLAVRSGNLAVSQVLLAHRDVHPSRAAKNGETPLQLAIKSKDLSILRLVIKDATVHDVQRCWDATDISDEMREVLRSKVCFTTSLGMRYSHLLSREASSIRQTLK